MSPIALLPYCELSIQRFCAFVKGLNFSADVGPNKVNIGILALANRCPQPVSLEIPIRQFCASKIVFAGDGFLKLISCNGKLA